MTGNSHSLISRQSAKIQQLKNGEQSHDLIMKHIFGTDLNVYYFNNFPSLDNFISIKLPSLAKKKKKGGTVSIREVNQQNRLESLEMDLCMYGSLIFKVTPSQWVLNNCLITGTGGKKKLSSNLYNK